MRLYGRRARFSGHAKCYAKCESYSRKRLIKILKKTGKLPSTRWERVLESRYRRRVKVLPITLYGYPTDKIVGRKSTKIEKKYSRAKEKARLAREYED